MRLFLSAKKCLLFNSFGAAVLFVCILLRFKLDDLRGTRLKNLHSASTSTDTHQIGFEPENAGSQLGHSNSDNPVVARRWLADKTASRRMPDARQSPLADSSEEEALPADAKTESDEAFRERIEALQKARQARLSSVCGNGSSVKTGRLGTIFNFDSLDLTYCCIAKCASTTFKLFLDKVTDRKCAGHYIHSCASAIFKRASSRADYRTNSLIIVRNPWERLVSAYTNKFVDEKFGSTAKPCYAYHRKSPKDKTISFAEFVECIIHNVQTGRGLNVHVAPLSWHCSPCNNRFSYIATLETFPDDLDYLFRYVLSSKKSVNEYWTAFGRIQRRKSEVANKTRLTYSSSYEALSKEQLSRLMKIYRTDALLYGYTTNPLNG